jgi:hypothetical protein
MDLSLDNAYNARLRQILHDLEKVDVINKQPEMLGGSAVRKYALSGNSGSYPEVSMLAELKEMGGSMCCGRSECGCGMCGGRQNKVRKTGLAKAVRTFGRAVKPLGKNLKPVKEALMERAVEEIEGPSMFAGRQSTIKKTGLAKAVRTFGRAVKPLGKNLKPVKEALMDRAVEEIMTAGRQSTVKKTGLAKALRTFGRVVKPLGKNLKPVKEALTERAVSEIMGSGMKKKRPASARAMIVKKVMAENGMSMIEASKYVKANGLY